MTVEELERRVKTLEDVEAIKSMHRDYVFWLTSGQTEEVIGCFAEDAVVRLRANPERRGREEIARMFREGAPPATRRNARLLVQPVVTVEGDRARGHWVMAHLLGPVSDDSAHPESLDWESGRYDCEYVREKEGWKFSRLIWTCPWPTQGPPT